MNTKIQELTDKIYQEGVEKARLDAENIMLEAKTQEQHLIEEAQEKAKKILEAAQKEAALIKKHTESELKLFTHQMVDALKIEIANMLTGKLTEDSVRAATADKAFMQQVILELVREWGKEQELIIQADMELDLITYFEKNAKELLNKGLVIEQVNGIKTNFQIVSKTEGYKIEFGDEQFIAYFKEFLRPKLLEILF